MRVWGTSANSRQVAEVSPTASTRIDFFAPPLDMNIRIDEGR